MCKGGEIMLNRIKELLSERGILLSAPLSLADCTVQKPYLLERAGIASGTAILFAVPYYTTDCDSDASNISAYAVSRDYHLFFKELFKRILPILQSEFPENRFAGFTDHSPILEAQAAVRAGLGYWGCNHLFLTSAHSSFVFLDYIKIICLCQGTMHRNRAETCQLSMNFAYCNLETQVVLYIAYICICPIDIAKMIIRRIERWPEYLIFPPVRLFCRKKSCAAPQKKCWITRAAACP
jgi:hypothetical protein